MTAFLASIANMFRARAAAPAIVQLADGAGVERTCDYAELERAAGAIAHAVTVYSGAGSTVGLVAANSIEWIQADLALLLGGHVEVPVPLAFSAAQAAHLLAACSVVLVDAEGAARMAEWNATGDAAALPCLRIEAIAAGSAPALPMPTDDDRVCKVIHTSGTTSAPKGVRIRSKGLDALVESLWRQVGKDDYARYLNLVPFSLLIEQVTALYMPFTSGGCVVLPPAGQPPLGEPGARIADKLALMRQAEPTAMTLPPSLVQALADRVRQIDAPDAAALNLMLFGRTTPPLIAAGGAPVAAATLRVLDERGIPVLQGYGLSENSSVVAWNTRADNRIGTVGRPLAHVECRCGPDGELAIRSASLFAGYSGSDPSACHTDADGWLWTGDLAHIDADGFITIAGRKKHLIITAHGRNVSPEPAEASYRSVPGVADIVLLGEGCESLSALVLTAPGTDTQALRAALERHGARHLSGVERASDFVFEPDSPALRGELFTVTGRPRRPAVEAYVRARRTAAPQAVEFQPT